jgi:hypothetical protein
MSTTSPTSLLDPVSTSNSNINELPDQLLTSLNELLSKSTVGHSDSNTVIPPISTLLPTDLLSGVGLNGVSLAILSSNMTSQAEMLLNYISLLKLQMIHNNNDNRLNSLQLQRDVANNTKLQNINTIENILDILYTICQDCKEYEQNSVLNFMQIDNE